MCFNRKVLVGLGVVALGVLAFAPSAFGAALPVLVLLACPLSMVFMMRAMRGTSTSGGGDQCATQAPAKQPAEAHADGQADADLTRLRAEVDQLRAELDDRRRAEPTF
jgi:hypothetical protein